MKLEEAKKKKHWGRKKRHGKRNLSGKSYQRQAPDREHRRTGTGTADGPQHEKNLGGASGPSFSAAPAHGIPTTSSALEKESGEPRLVASLFSRDERAQTRTPTDHPRTTSHDLRNLNHDETQLHRDPFSFFEQATRWATAHEFRHLVAPSNERTRSRNYYKNFWRESPRSTGRGGGHDQAQDEEADTEDAGGPARRAAYSTKAPRPGSLSSLSDAASTPPAGEILSDYSLLDERHRSRTTTSSRENVSPVPAPGIKSAESGLATTPGGTDFPQRQKASAEDASTTHLEDEDASESTTSSVEDEEQETSFGERRRADGQNQHKSGLLTNSDSSSGSKQTEHDHDEKAALAELPQARRLRDHDETTRRTTGDSRTDLVLGAATQSSASVPQSGHSFLCREASCGSVSLPQRASEGGVEDEENGDRNLREHRTGTPIEGDEAPRAASLSPDLRQATSTPPPGADAGLKIIATQHLPLLGVGAPKPPASARPRPRRGPAPPHDPLAPQDDGEHLDTPPQLVDNKGAKGGGKKGKHKQGDTDANGSGDEGGGKGMHMLLPSTTSLDPDAAGAIAIAKQEAIKGKGGPSRPRTSTRPAKGAIAKQAAMKGKGGLPGTATRSAPASPGANHEIFSKANILPGGKDNEGGRTDGTKKGGTEGGAGDATNGSSENRKTGAAERINFNKSGSGGIPKNGAADGKSGAAGSGDGNRTPPQVTPPGPSGRRGAAASQMPEAAGTGVVATTSPAATGSVWRSVSHLLPSRRLTSPTTLMSGGTRERGGEMGGKGADGASGAGGSATAGPVLGESSVEEGEGHIASPTSSPAAPPEGSRPKRFSSTPIRAAGAALQAVGAAPSRAWQATVGRFARMAGDRAPEQLSAERSKGAGSAREVQATGQRSGAPGPARSPGEPAGGTGLMNPVNVYVQGVDPVVSGRTRKAQADEEFNQQIQAHLLRATAAQTAEVSAPSGSALPAALAAPPAFLRAENLTGRQLVYVQQLSLGAAGAPDLMRRLAASLASSPTGESSGHSSATHSAVQEFNHYIWAELKNRAKGGAQRTSEDALLPAPLPLSPHPAPPPASYQRAASAMTRGQRVIYVQRLDTDIPRQEVQTVEDFNRQVLMNMKLFEKANAAPEKMVVGPHGSKPPYSASHRNIVATPGQTNVVFVQGLDDDVRRFQSDYLRRWATADTGRPFAAGPSSSGRGQAAQVAAAVGEFNKKMQERLFVQHRGAVGDRNEAGKQDGTGAGQRATTAQETRKASGSDVRKTQEARRHDFLREGERRSPAERLEKDCADVLWKDLQASEYQQAVAPIVDKLEPICYRYAHEQQGASLSPWCVERAPSPSQCYDLLVSARVVFAEENPELARRAAQIQEIGPGKVTKMALLKGDLEKEIATLKKIRERIRKAGPGGEQQYKTTLRVLYNVILGKDERSEEALLTPNERRRLFLLFPDIADRAREGFKEMENMIRKLPAIAMQNNIHKRLGHADDAVVRAHFDPQTERLLRVAAEELYPGAHQEYWRLEPLPAERGREPGAAGRNGISFLQLQQIPVSSSLKAHTAQASISEVLPYTQQPGSHGFPASGAETRLSELITTCPGEIIAELFPREEGQGNAAAAAHLSPQCAISAASLAGVFAGLAFLIFLRCFCWASPNRRRRAGSNNSCRSKFFTCGSRNSSSAEGEGRTDYFPRARRRADSVSTSSSEEEGGETTGKGYDMQGARVQLQLERSKYEYDAEAGLTVHDEGATNPGDCAAATAGDGHAVLGITTCEGQGRAEDHPEDPSFSTQEAGSFCILLQNLQATPAAWTSVLARRFSFAAKLFHPTRIRLLFDGGARNTGDENHALQHPLRVVDPEAQQECGTGQESEQGQSLYDLLPIRMINNVAEDEPGSTSLMPRKGKTDLRQEHKRDSLLQHHLQLELPEQSQSGPDETEQQTLVQISDDEGPPHDAQHLHDRNVALHEGALLFSRYGRVGEDAPQHDHLHGDVVERYPASQHHLPHGGAAAGHFHAEGDQLRRYGLRTTAGTSNGPPTETHYEYGAASDTENEDEEQAVLQAFLLRCETSSTAGRQSVWFRVRATLQRYWNFAMILQDDEQIEIDNHGGEGLRPGTSTSG